MTVTNLPTRGIPRQVRPQEIYAARKPSNKQVWTACSYMNDPLQKCMGCPELEDGKFGKSQRMCYGLAQELCRAIFALDEIVDDE